MYVLVCEIRKFLSHVFWRAVTTLSVFGTPSDMDVKLLSDLPSVASMIYAW